MTIRGLLPMLRHRQSHRRGKKRELDTWLSNQFRLLASGGLCTADPIWTGWHWSNTLGTEVVVPKSDGFHIRIQLPVGWRAEVFAADCSRQAWWWSVKAAILRRTRRMPLRQPGSAVRDRPSSDHRNSSVQPAPGANKPQCGELLRWLQEFDAA